MDDGAGVPENGTTTRLERLETDISNIKDRLSGLETEFETAKETAKEERALVQTQIAEMDGKLDKVISFIEGTDKVLGFCRKHWRTILKFGCGFVTAYGVSNPSVQHTLSFVQNFFGL
jgi:O6-methylguanine-DNA--protein-cysteine methyltransferase